MFCAWGRCALGVAGRCVTSRTNIARLAYSQTLLRRTLCCGVVCERANRTDASQTKLGCVLL
jgi:hypothetical protein